MGVTRPKKVYPMAKNWYSIAQLEKKTGRSQPWIAKFLKSNDVARRRLRSVETKRVGWHYPHRSLQMILEFRPAPPAGDWVNAYMITKATGRSDGWVADRLSTKKYCVLMEIRLDDRLIPRCYYPPWVLTDLKRSANDFDAFPEAEDFLTLTEVCTLVGRATYWVLKRIELLNIESEWRRDKRGRIHEFYSPKDAAALKNLADQEHDAPVDWLTRQQMAKILNVTPHAISKRLIDISHRTRIGRVASNGRVETVYSPNTLRKLRASFKVNPFNELVAIGDRARALQAYRERHGMTQRTLSELIGYDVSKLHKPTTIRRSLATRIDEFLRESAQADDSSSKG